MIDENTKKFNGIFAKILQVDSKKIDDALSPLSLPAWDSFNSLLLIGELEKEFGTHFAPNEVMAIKNVGDIKAGLRKKGVAIR